MPDQAPSHLPRPIPNGDSLPYWNAARERRLLIRHCRACGAKHFMPRHLCPACWSSDLEWLDSPGDGIVQSFSIIHRAPTPVFTANGPYVIALIDLDEGPRMFANVIGPDAREVEIGDRVKVTFEDRCEGFLMPQFSRVTGAART